MLRYLVAITAAAALAAGPVLAFDSFDGEAAAVSDLTRCPNPKTRDTGYGAHTDKEMAEAWVTAIATRFAPEAVDRVLDAFRGNADASIAVAWPVLSVLFDDRQHVVIADLEQPGMTAHVYLRPYLKVDIFSSGEMVQTDGCYAFT